MSRVGRWIKGIVWSRIGGGYKDRYDVDDLYMPINIIPVSTGVYSILTLGDVLTPNSKPGRGRTRLRKRDKGLIRRARSKHKADNIQYSTRFVT